MESCVYRTSGSQTCIRSCREKDLQTSVLGRTSGSIPEFLWNREKLPEKWVPVLPRPLKSLDFPSAKQGFSENIWMQEREKAVNHCCIYGVFCAEMQIPLEEALTHYLYAQTSAIVTNCVKTIPLSQTSGQQLLSGCYGGASEILKDVMNRSEEDPCLSAPGFDIRGISMRSCIPGYICRSLNLVLVYSRLKRG